MGSLVDAASGGALVDKTPMEARNLIANMAANSQQFGYRLETPIRRVNEVGINFDIQQQLATLTSLVQTMAMRDNLPRPCGVCLMVGHMTRPNHGSVQFGSEPKPKPESVKIRFRFGPRNSKS